jgi:hypothetical protein
MDTRNIARTSTGALICPVCSNPLTIPYKEMHTDECRKWAVARLSKPSKFARGTWGRAAFRTVIPASRYND